MKNIEKSLDKKNRMKKILAALAFVINFANASNVSCLNAQHIVARGNDEIIIRYSSDGISVCTDGEIFIGDDSFLDKSQSTESLLMCHLTNFCGLEFSMIMKKKTDLNIESTLFFNSKVFLIKSEGPTKIEYDFKKGFSGLSAKSLDIRESENYIRNSLFSAMFSAMVVGIAAEEIVKK
ncbi:MAG: hypothetical protein HEEMFOPI_01458 [Holosporales bacterium]